MIMAITLKVRKFLRGDPYVELLDFDLLGEDNLPKEYLEGAPAVYKRDGRLFVEFSDSYKNFYYLREKIPYNKFKDILDACREAGSRLKEINRKLREEYKDFDGREETYII